MSGWLVEVLAPTLVVTGEVSWGVAVGGCAVAVAVVSCNVRASCTDRCVRRAGWSADEGLRCVWLARGLAGGLAHERHLWCLLIRG